MIETANPDATVEERAKIVPFFRKVGFAFIGLDLEGFTSGKMNRILS
jgi:PP-loop superfamily ATP-utilizing enzyme